MAHIRAALRPAPGVRAAVAILAVVVGLCPIAPRAQGTAPVASAQAVGVPSVGVPADPQLRIAAAIEAGADDEARRIAAASGATAVDLDYIEGRILLRQGRPREAALKFRAVIRAEPGARLARWYLVAALVQSGQYDTALYQIDRLIAQARDAGERQGFEFQRQAILARRPYGFTFGVSLTPSSNINRATSNTEIPGFGGLTGTIDEQGKTGVGFSADAGAFRRYALGAGAALRFDAFAGGTWYSDSIQDRGYAGIAATATEAAANGTYALRAEVVRGIYRDDRNDFSLAALTAERRFALTDTQVGLGLRLARQVYDVESSRIFDNTRAQVFGTLEHVLTPRIRLRGGLRLTLSDAADDRFSYIAQRLDLGASREWAAGWAVSVGGFAENKPFERDFGALFDGPRHDQTFGLDIAVRNSRLVVLGTTPEVSCEMSRTRSNIAFYDNLDVQECSLTLTRRF